jgi:hypothetical protein
MKRLARISLIAVFATLALTPTALASDGACAGKHAPILGLIPYC